jgi:hypothetical protein
MNKSKSKKLVNSLRNLVDSIGYNDKGSGLVSLYLNAGFTGETLYEITQILSKNGVEFEVVEHIECGFLEIETDIDYRIFKETDIDCNKPKIMKVKDKIFIPELPDNFFLIVIEHEKCYKLALDMGDSTFIDTNIILGVNNYNEALDMALDMIEVLGDCIQLDEPLYVTIK